MNIKRIDDFETTLKIGYQGENLARSFEWDLREWVEEFGEGTPTLLVQRSGDPAAYPVSITFEDNVLRWTPTSADTAQPGVGELQLRYTVSEIVVKERVMSMVVKDSLDDGETPPDPWSGWVDEVIQAKADAESARDQAQDAQTAAESAQTAAETAQAAAETAQGKAEAARDQAGNYRTQAVDARNDAVRAKADAETAQVGAETAQGKAEAAQTAAETAQGKAEDAQSAAESAQTAAETAQGLAEDAQSAAETAQGKAEDAQSAAEEAAAASAANQYIAFATDDASSFTRTRFLLGADSIPVKSASVTQTSLTVPQTWIIRRTGKNLFDRDTMTFVRGSSIKAGSTTEGRGTIFSDSSTTNIAACLNYIPVIPGMRLLSRGIAKSGVNVYLRMVAYNADKSYLSYYTNNVAAGGVGSDFSITVPANARFVRFCCYAADIDPATKKTTSDVQIELQEDTSSTTPSDYEAYHGEDTPVVVTEPNTATVPTTLPTTLFGQNVIVLFPSGSLTDADPTVAIDPITAEATMDLTYRLDPTLVYNQLRAAIVAAGS